VCDFYSIDWIDKWTYPWYKCG